MSKLNNPIAVAMKKRYGNTTSVMKDRRQPRGGAKNESDILLQEYEEEMSEHMKKQIVFGTWWKIETNHGTEFIESDLVEGYTTEKLKEELLNYIEGNRILEDPELVEGWGVRLSAPGYLDKTEWAVLDSEKEAEEYLDEFLGANG